MTPETISQIAAIIQDEEKTAAVLAVLRKTESARKEAAAHLQSKGIAAARARGVQFGRPKKPAPANFEKIYRLYIAKKLTVIEAASSLGISRYKFRELVSHRKQKENQE